MYIHNNCTKECFRVLLKGHVIVQLLDASKAVLNIIPFELPRNGKIHSLVFQHVDSQIVTPADCWQTWEPFVP
jgi:hypothetical protein